MNGLTPWLDGNKMDECDALAPFQAGRSLQNGHDSQAGSAAHGLRVVPSRVLQERRPLRHSLVPWVGPGGIALYRTERALRAEEKVDGVTALLARRVPLIAPCAVSIFIS